MSDERIELPDTHDFTLLSVSISSYADLMGCNERTVRDAIEAGKINEGVDRSGAKRKIFPEIATREWARNYAPEKIQNPVLTARLRAAAEDGEDPISEGLKGDLNEKTDITEAERQEKVYKALLRKLEYERMIGVMVHVDTVKKAQFIVFQALRTDLQGVAERIVDKVRISPDRAAGVNIIREEIERVLLDVTNLDNIKFTE